MGKMRADAVRNRRLLLDAAAAEFAEHGMDASVAQIAVRAGIGKGTVFRHFATKEQLITAIFADQLDGLAATGEELLGALAQGAAAEALRAFMSAGVELQVGDRSFCQAAGAISRADPQVRRASERLAAVAESLTAAARREGTVRDDVTGHDIVLLINAAFQATAPLGEAMPELWRRYLGVIFDGLRPESARPLPVPPPEGTHFTAAVHGP